MSSYLVWKKETISDLSGKNIDAMYDHGFVFTRKGRGEVDQTRSLRIDLSKFELSSENRRVLRKIENIQLKIEDLPYKQYDWQIGKMAKDFYDTKFGHGTFSANKAKELLTDPEKSNFNTLFAYSFGEETVGYCICAQTDQIIHYCYPFYNLHSEIKNLGMGMMLPAIEHAKESGKKYIYLGSFQRPTDIYKLQFTGLEWFDGEHWQTETSELKSQITNSI